MDSITQAALGASIGEAMMGKKMGYKAAVWGAALGTLPDLDILINPFIDNVVEMRNHRGFTHSIFFCLIFSPLIGSLLHRRYNYIDTGPKRWTWMVFLIFITHIAIDTLTTYGTQVLYPLTDTPFTTDSVFIIDPLYTIPLVSGLAGSLLMKKKSKNRMLINGAGLFLSAMYLVWGLGIKSHVHRVYSESFKNQYGYHEKLKTTPNGPTSFLWTGYVLKADTVYNAVYSVFDRSQHLKFTPVPRNTRLIEPYMDDRGTKTLLWFSRGYYTVEEADTTLIFYDLRFGRDDFWLTDNGEYVWKNFLLIDDNNRAYSFEQKLPSFDTRSQNLSLYLERIRGK